MELLLRLMPIIMDEGVFAVHGGTAINLFLKDLPRYSVDIDLTYIPLSDRQTSIADINKHLASICEKAVKAFKGMHIIPNYSTCKLLCEYRGQAGKGRSEPDQERNRKRSDCIPAAQRKSPGGIRPVLQGGHCASYTAIRRQNRSCAFLSALRKALPHGMAMSSSISKNTRQSSGNFSTLQSSPNRIPRNSRKRLQNWKRSSRLHYKIL